LSLAIHRSSGERTCSLWLFAGTILILGVLAVQSIYREISIRHFFHADDWAWLYYAEFRSTSELFSFFPQAIYNDRPVGALLINLVYEIFGLNHFAFLSIQVLIDVPNSLLIWKIVQRYIGLSGAFLTGIISATWISANSAVFWTAAIFDLFGAFLCLVTILLWQVSREANYSTRLLFSGATVYFLAVRTKEFAIGLPLILVATEVFFDGRSLRTAMVRLRFHLVVMGLLALRYLHLAWTSNILGNPEDQYGLTFSSLPENLWFYWSNLWYADAFGSGPSKVAIGMLVLGSLFSRDYRRFALFSLFSLVVLLGPTLLLTRHLDPLYLYAPHFFSASFVGALVLFGLPGRMLSIVVGFIMVLAPLNSTWYTNTSRFIESKSAMTRSQFDSLNRLIDDFEPGTTIFINGLEPYFNPFSYGPGHSLRVRDQDSSLVVRVQEESNILKTEFCQASYPRRFFSFEGSNAFDETSLISSQC
jgi:hypothetical protein